LKRLAPPARAQKPENPEKAPQRLENVHFAPKWHGPGSLEPDFCCWGAQAFEMAQNGNGRLLLRVGMDLGWRRVGLGLAPRQEVSAP
jgi:hypothetical protein